MLVSATSGGFVGAAIGAIAGIGTSVLLPGLGLIIAGPLAAGLIGALLGSVIGLFVAAIIILTRRKTYP